MKRALIAAAFGGFLAFLVPQAASGGTARPVAPYDHPGDHKADCPGQTEGANETQQAPAPRSGDREQEHSDGGEILF